MTQYIALVANHPLPEIDLSGARMIKIRDMKKMYPITEDFPQQSWHLMDDDAEIYNIPSEEALRKLQIFEWESQPYDLQDYHDKAFVYCVDCSWDEPYVQDLLAYLQQHLTAGHEAELIRFWAGNYEDFQPLKKYEIAANTLTLADFEQWKLQSYVRVKFI